MLLWHIEKQVNVFNFSTFLHRENTDDLITIHRPWFEDLYDTIARNGQAVDR